MRVDILRGGVILLDVEIAPNQLIAGIAFFYGGLGEIAQSGPYWVRVPEKFQALPTCGCALNLTLELHHVPTLEEPAPTVN